MNFAANLRKLLSMILLMNLAACTTGPQRVAVPTPGNTPPTTQVFVGARVRVVKLDGKELEFKVLEITPSGLKSKHGVVPYADMQSLTILRPSAENTLIVLSVLAALVGIIALGQVIGDVGGAAVYNSSN